MLLRARLCHCMSFVCLSVRNIQIPHRRTSHGGWGLQHPWPGQSHYFSAITRKGAATWWEKTKRLLARMQQLTSVSSPFIGQYIRRLLVIMHDARSRPIHVRWPQSETFLIAIVFLHLWLSHTYGRPIGIASQQPSYSLHSVQYFYMDVFKPLWRDRTGKEMMTFAIPLESLIITVKTEMVYGCVQRREDDHCVKRILEAEVHGRRKRGRQKKRWINTISQDLISLNLTPWQWTYREDRDNYREEEPVWLTPHLRDSQPGGERRKKTAQILSTPHFVAIICRRISYKEWFKYIPINRYFLLMITNFRSYS